MKRLLPLFVVVALAAGTALATVPNPIFEFNPTTLELTIDTGDNGVALESWAIPGPDAMAGLNDPPFDTYMPLPPPYQAYNMYEWESKYWIDEMQTFDNLAGLITDGSNPTYPSPSILYAVYPEGTTLEDFGEVSYFWSITVGTEVIEDGIATVPVTPEPATLTLLGIGGLLALRRRR